MTVRPIIGTEIYQQHKGCKKIVTNGDYSKAPANPNDVIGHHNENGVAHVLRERLNV
jgi:hypothetical protein